MHMQQIGRGMRPANGKGALIVLDFAGNIKRHGLPDHDRVWTLHGVEKQSGEAPVKECPGCSAIVLLAARECPNCGFVFARPKDNEPPNLVEIAAIEALVGMPYWQIKRL